MNCFQWVQILNFKKTAEKYTYCIKVKPRMLYISLCSRWKMFYNQWYESSLSLHYITAHLQHFIVLANWPGALLAEMFR